MLLEHGELTASSGCEPLTPDDIAEIIVFTATRRENVVIADTLVFPSHQVSFKQQSKSRAFLTRWTIGRSWHHAQKGNLE